MLAYALTCALLCIPALVLAMQGAHTMAMALFPIPVALHWAEGSRRRGFGLVACAAFVAFLSGAGLIGIGLYVLAAGVGVLMGVACRRRWTFGRATAAVASVAFIPAVALIALDFETFRKQTTILLNVRIAEFEKVAQETGSWLATAVADSMRWQDLHLANVVFGEVFALILGCSALALAVLAWFVGRREPESGPRGRFKDARTSEWLVWVAILIAVLWFVDQKWSNDALRFITWNSAVGLIAVYWLNGFSILVYALDTFKVQQPALSLAAAAVFILGIYVGIHPVLGVIGLFDTWWDFRQRFDSSAAMRRANNEKPDNDE